MVTGKKKKSHKGAIRVKKGEASMIRMFPDTCERLVGDQPDGAHVVINKVRKIIVFDGRGNLGPTIEAFGRGESQKPVEGNGRSASA